MRPGLPRRIASATLATAFLFALGGEALATHPCPHHLAAAAAVSHDTGHGTGHGTDEGSHGPCTCVGRCHAGAAPPLVVALLLGVVPVPEPPAASERAPQPPDRTAIAPFSLPWANAPPTL